MDIFKDNPLLMEHPLYGHPDSGINLPEVFTKDVECLLQVLRTASSREIKKEFLKGLQHVAKQLKVELILDKVSDSAFRVQAVPTGIDNSLKSLANQEKIEEENSLETNESLSSFELDDEQDEVSSEIDESKSKTFAKSRQSCNTNPIPLEIVKTELEEDNGDDDLDINNIDTQDNVCPICNITCKTAAGLKIHIGHSHKDNEDMLSEKGICPICHVTCKSKTGVQIHIGHAHRDVEVFDSQDEEKANVICKCGKTFSKHSKNLLRTHRQKCPAFRKAAFICDICESPFISMPALTTHLIAIHGITKEANSCICGQSFGSRGSCRKHAITCQAYKNAAIFCRDCDLPFLTNGHLKQHLRTTSHRQMAKRRKK
ncbi:zinc finger and BTB domain-containing protein 48-like protein [Leptotrombidium deliense]|uniref:Zinc finger and BTB domain-containing protein 48-like protein n=1 Tax=Leptotrombidium deliense TaxID=299467 RepID=A0A443S7E9_9ACAR|nr:zinc finger and BTB domain-containing protein 48-like protein [Leptotrombidium deliense]